MLTFVLPEKALGRICVFDASGRLVRTLLSGSALMPGANTVLWDGRDGPGREVPSGVYLVRVEAGDRVVTSKVTRTR